ncbi:ribonuclease H-like domain-containing protein [Rhizophagus clarus]|uniref:Ribonuclease H-like domain-containing protein n=1 Tax=Rhizophagus clarus TaxID=94130 RepID=A0A8H3M581_9GLOM|nr:ribonuclease H-like domain-containing protein [Rhizophagus clarus]
MPNNKGPIPLWYKHMIDQYTINSNTLRLNFDLPQLPQQHLRMKRPKKNFTLPNQTIRPRNTWTYFWSPVIKDIIPTSTTLTPNHHNYENTPKSHDNILRPCDGCNLHYPYYIADFRPKYVILQPLDKSLDLKIKPKGMLPNNRTTSTTSSFLKEKLCQTTKSHHTLRTLAYNDYLRMHQALNSDTASTTGIILKDASVESIQYPLSFLHFYFSLSQQDITMGLGWHVTRPTTPIPISFSGACKHFPSSTKAEAYAICTALIICPLHTTVNIYTDSQYCINTFYNITQRLITPRRQLKIPNHHIWFVIMKVIKDNHLTVNLHKVKAHSNNVHNYKADTLAKAGHTSTYLIELNKHHIPTNIHIVWDQHHDNITIDHNIWHITQDIGNRQKFYAWLDYKTNLALKTVSYNQEIDWPLTEKFFNFNPNDRPTSHKLTKFRAWQHKAINNLIPTMDIISLCYPNLFQDVSNCWSCNLHPETNTSLWLCSINLKVLRPHIVKYTQDLLQYIHQTCDYEDFLLSQEINNNAIFRFFLSPSGSMPPPDLKSPFILTCQQIITHDFSALFRGKYKSKKTLHNTILFKFYELTQLIKRIIWKPRNDSFKKWKTAHQVNKHTYRQYRRKHKRLKGNDDSQLIGADKYQCSRQDHTHDNNTNVQHFYQTASFHSLQDHSVAFIYAMSSNFRHHGPCSSVAFSFFWGV